jgi:AraC family ethanolamine operon transcriptional activator
LKTHTYQDFDTFAGEVSSIDARMMLQNPKSRRWTINRLDLPGAQIQLGLLGSGNIVEGQSWSDGYLLYLPLTRDCRYAANGTTIERGSLMVLEPGCEFCIATKDPHDWCAIYVPTEHLFADGPPPYWFEADKKPACRVSPSNLHLANEFYQCVREVMASARNHKGFEVTPAARQAAAHAQRIVSFLISKLPTIDAGKTGRPEIPREEIIRGCENLLEQREDAPIRVGELSSATGVCERTLRTAFKDYYGIGPVRYLQARQLHQVHSALRAADADTATVADVLFQRGVWELGRFARRYREAFGELPSQTLRTTSRSG